MGPLEDQGDLFCSKNEFFLILLLYKPVKQSYLVACFCGKTPICYSLEKEFFVLCENLYRGE